MKIEKYSLIVGPITVFCWAIICLFQVANSEVSENHCFTCHTNPRKLIEITRELAKSVQDKPGASVETEGEG